YDPALSNGGFFNALVAVNLPVVNGTTRSAQFLALALQTETLRNNALLNAQELRRSIGTQYITAYGLGQQVKFNRTTLDLLRREEVILKRLTEQNVYAQIDYLTFLGSLRQQETTVRQLEIQYRKELGTLNYLAGILDTALVMLPDPQLALPQILPSANSALYQKYVLDSLQIQADDRLIDNAYRPSFNLLGDAGFNSSFENQGGRNFGFSVGATATVPIYDGQQRRLRHERSVLLENTRQGYRDVFLRQYQQETLQAQQQLAALDELDQSIQAQLQNARTLIEANGRLLRTGEARVLDYLMAIGNLMTAQNQLSLNAIDRFQIYNQLNFRTAVK
ncbi:MAG: TolC family protein, partial [Saprospiraceae bacterium]